MRYYRLKQAYLDSQSGATYDSGIYKEGILPKYLTEDATLVVDVTHSVPFKHLTKKSKPSIKEVDKPLE